MATPEAQAKGQNPAYKPAHRHHSSDLVKRTVVELRPVPGSSRQIRSILVRLRTD